MELLKFGDTGSLVALLQKALQRAGYDIAVDGVFGSATRAAVAAFQRRAGLTVDGVVGAQTQRVLQPWYLGYERYTVRPGDTLWRLARDRGISLRTLETANPGLDPFDLRPGRVITLPFPFEVVPRDVPVSSRLTEYCVRGLAARYPFLQTGELGRSELGRPLWQLTLGSGRRRVFYNASHHANEWITTLLLLRYVEELCAAYAVGGQVFGTPAQELLAASTIVLAPLVNPDGVDLVTGTLTDPVVLASARRIAADYPAIPFPDGWKANIRGVDLNLQYPAGWDEARRIKEAQGFVSPAPRDFVGSAPLSESESRAMADATLRLSPALILAYHTQGEVIYWKYLDQEAPGARELGERFAAVSGYTVEDTPVASGYAGYKDWFILRYNRPGYTIEAGSGENPLPVTQLEEIYRDNVGILTIAALG